jgi:N-acetylglucosaminyldiphosphoundecaprenol N-acetyl-beta-D-mannosaminyltransferase
MNEISIWQIKINPISKIEIVELIDKHISCNKSIFHLTGVNPETITQAQKNEDLRKSIISSDIVNIDNMLVVTFLRILGYKISERAACPDIFEQLLFLSNKKGYRIYFLGAKEEVLQLMLKKLLAKYPNLNIVGSRNGYFNPKEELSIVEEIWESNPDLLFVALPTPQKELFIQKYKDILGTRFAFGVGGVFDVQAEKVKRAPLWMRNIGLEGIHRAFQNPANYGSRYIKFYIPFLKLFLKELFSRISGWFKL